MACFQVKFVDNATNDERHDGMMRVTQDYVQSDGFYYCERDWNVEARGATANLQGMIEQASGQGKVASIKVVAAIPADAV